MSSRVQRLLEDTPLRAPKSRSSPRSMLFVAGGCGWRTRRRPCQPNNQPHSFWCVLRATWCRRCNHVSRSLGIRVRNPFVSRLILGCGERRRRVPHTPPHTPSIRRCRRQPSSAGGGGPVHGFVRDMQISIDPAPGSRRRAHPRRIFHFRTSLALCPPRIRPQSDCSTPHSRTLLVSV